MGDCINNVAHVGHCHPHITEVASKQIGQLYTNNRYLHDGLSTYVERLTALFPDPLTVCYLCNSGSEANDLALQLAKAHTGGSEIITVDGAYHGHLKSVLEISPYKWRSRDQKPSYVHVADVPCPIRGKHRNDPNQGKSYATDMNEQIQNLKKDGKQIAAFIMESFMGCGGQIIPPKGYMTEMFKYVREAGGVCIADEVQVGFGGAGTHFWAFETQGAIPDIVTIGKPMGNGHPIAAVVTTQAIADSWYKLARSYFNTYAGNPVSCAIGHAVLDIIEDEGLQKHAAEVGAYAVERCEKELMKYPFVGNVRGYGLFFGIEIVTDKDSMAPHTKLADEIYCKMRNLFIIISTDGPYDNVLKMKPPMCFTKENVDELVKALDEVMATC